MKSTRIAELEAEIAAARRDEQEQSRAEHVQQLRDVTRELNEKEIELAQIEQQVKLENELALHYIRRIASLQAAVGQSLGRRPQSAAWLTAEEDVEIAKWERQHKEYENNLAAIIAERDAMPKVDRVRAIQLSERVSYLRQAKINIVNLLGGSLNQLQGGIFSVG